MEDIDETIRVVNLALSYLFIPNNSIGLLLYGEPGTGKTTILKEIKALIDRYNKELPSPITYKMLDVRNVLDMYKEDTAGFRNFVGLDLVLIDDVGTEDIDKKNFGSSLPAIKELIEVRYNIGKQTILSSNLSPEDFREAYSDRVYDRLQDYFLVKFKNKSHRGR